MKKLLYKFGRSILPCVLLTLCIGWCYSFSLFAPHLATLLGCTSTQVAFTFCLNIFFLGMGAALFGPLVERWIKRAAFLSSLLLILGLLVSALACHVGNVWLMWIGCGVLCGLAEGIGYLTPNKNMMLWFPTSNYKGFLTAISIFTFGLGSSLCAWLFGMLFPLLGISGTFLALAVVYAIPLIVSTILIQKPRYALVQLSKKTRSEFSYIETVKDRYFQKCWLFMFLNISMGLILIGSCATFLGTLGFSASSIITLMMLCGIFNGVGRLVFPAIGDFLNNRSVVWVITALVEVLLMVPVMIAYSTGVGALCAAGCIVLIHAGYGSAFACLPGILSTHFGKDTLSQRHGFCLTSWGMASLMAFLCSTFVLKTFTGHLPIMVLVAIGYAVNILVSASLTKDCSTEKHHL